MTTSKTLKPLMLRPDQDFNKDLASVIVTALKAGIAPLKKRLDALEARPQMRYLGVHVEGTTHAEGDCVTRGGSMWISRTNQNRATPGLDGGVSWTLAVKHGRDAR